MVPKDGLLVTNPLSSKVQLIFIAMTITKIFSWMFEMNPPGQFLGPTEKGMKDIWFRFMPEGVLKYLDSGLNLSGMNL